MLLRFADHARYLDAWFDELGLDSVTVAGHDWGGALAFDWAARHQGRTRAVAYSLDEAADAHRALAARTTIGKTVLRP
jgi:pimeloyl-ACP methyl ester carboxylesterase